ncbi:hypothetical protein FOMG_04503 [Fusarium oxysporum f. sp. melonis 26406]|uniref:Protein OrfX2/OrfX3/P47 domain-containing protein n=1 Tax=Fusarium oxysporum f. sp. melonis 26406 TaxID=1089452 RepID=X0AK15_FUSOX|nr:hypothetical protein FOMG_04503 [Fusarium oxysporum f. sp. melonis 26406]
MAFITTNGWDTVFATNYTNLNQQIAAQWSSLVAKAPSLGTITASIGDKANVNIDMSPWQLTQGGSGGLVKLVLPIKSGIFKGIMDNYALGGQNILIELALEWVPQPNQIQFSIDDNVATVQADLNKSTTVTTAIIHAFENGKVTLSSSATVSPITTGVTWKITDPSSGMSFYAYITNVGGGSSMISVYQYVVHSLMVAPDHPITPVTVISAGNISDRIDGPILKELIADNIDRNLKEFNFVFATVDVVTQLVDTDVWAWLQPTTNGYAVVEPLENPTNDSCTFAILSMVNNRTAPKAALQVDVNAIAKDCTSSLLISPYMFLKYMLAPGVSSIFQGSSKTDFTIDEGNLSVINSNKLTWANVELESGKTVQLSVDTGHFAMTIQNDRITLSFSNLNYPITLLGGEVGKTNIIFNGQFKLSLKTGTNGNKTLWFDVPENQPNVTNVSAVMDDAYFTVELVVGIITIALSVICIGGVIGKAIASRAATAALKEAGAVEATASSSEIRLALQDLLKSPAAKRAFIGEAGADALNMLGKASISANRANMWSSVAKWTGTLAALTGLADGTLITLGAVLEHAAQHNWDNTPAFKGFANRTIAPYTFGGLKTFEVQTASLAGSLQIGFTAAA